MPGWRDDRSVQTLMSGWDDVTAPGLPGKAESLLSARRALLPGLTVLPVCTDDYASGRGVL